MSVEMMSRVFELDLESNQKFVLLVLADCADQAGNCYPAIPTISRRTSLSERTVQRALRDLMLQKIVWSYWDYIGQWRSRKVRQFRINISGVTQAPRPDYSHCSPAMRREIIEQFRHVCSYCRELGDELNGPDKKPWHIDRILPGSRGGLYVADNVTLSCGSCNSSKGAKLAPPKIQSLGAKLAEQGCQLGGTEGANLADRGCQVGTLSSSGDPSSEPSVNHQRVRATKKPEQLKLEEPAPAGLNQEAWKLWLDYRKKIGRTLKPVSHRAAMKRLARYGEDQLAVVEQSMGNGYQGLFALKPDDPTRTPRTRLRTADEIEADERNKHAG